MEDKEKELKIKENVVHTGIVTESELVDLYNLVDLFIFPSLYEGFGLPVIEAMACGTKVVSSNSSSLPEVGGDKIPYFDPKNVDEMAEAIEKELEREEEEGEKQKRIDWAKNFDWKKTSEEIKNYFEIYKKQ
ncbi:MAG: glycosyltransferase family 4 protein [Clostridia bacterium]|nr:glycosyltransferase family 4 protein [Clostridia bacterium]